MTRRVTVVDYGLGNLHSVVKALHHEGADIEIAAAAHAIESADRLVLPGVGAFRDGMMGLVSRGLCDSLKTFFQKGRPFLGICLGMQLLMAESEEFGIHQGLDFIPGRVIELTREPGLKVPHIGWNRIAPPPGATWKSTLLEATAPGTMVYFVHSFAPVPGHQEHRLAEVCYGASRICAAVQRQNVVGCQFHPEKSGPAGLAILRRFVAL
jgi:glutamine amidotransferase